MICRGARIVSELSEMREGEPTHLFQPFVVAKVRGPSLESVLRKDLLLERLAELHGVLYSLAVYRMLGKERGKPRESFLGEGGERTYRLVDRAGCLPYACTSTARRELLLRTVYGAGESSEGVESA